MPGGKKKAWRKKRKYELGHQPANTMLSSNMTVRQIRVRGGNVKWRATDWIPGTTHGVVKLSPAKYVCFYNASYYSWGGHHWMLSTMLQTMSL